MTVAIKRAPKHAPGQGVAQAMHRSQRWIKSADFDYDDSSANLIEVPGDVLIVGGFVSVKTAFQNAGTSAAATVVITAPDAEATELWNANSVGLLATGLKAFDRFALTPASGGYVAATYTAGTTATGQFCVYVAYVEPESEL